MMNAPLPNREHGTRSIGAILIDAGRLDLESAERILRLQKEKGLRFGDAAISLGILNEADIQFALARQFDYPYLLRGQSKVSEEVVAAYNPFVPQVEALRALRSQLMLRWLDSDDAHRTLAIVSPEPGEGRTFIAANLAVVFSQLGERTLLIDADMRRPRQHRLFNLEGRVGLSEILSGRSTANEAVQKVESLLGLSVLLSGAVPPNPQELLARPLFADLLRNFAKEFDVILIDTSAADHADALTVASRAGAAMVVASKNKTRSRPLRRLTDEIAGSGGVVVGCVLNEIVS